MREHQARLTYYWSKVRQELKAGNIKEASAWLDEASTREGLRMFVDLTERAGQFCRREIER